jgi:hypothetical protein
MPFEDTLHHFAHILKQVKAVGNLHRIGSAAAGSISILVRAVTGNEFDTGVLLQPLLDDLGRAVRLEIHWPMGIEVDKNGSVDQAFAKRKVVDTEVSWGRSGNWGCAASEAQERICTEGHSLTAGQTKPAFAADFEAEVSLLSRETSGAARKTHGQLRNRLAEGLARAGGVVTEEASDVEEENRDVGEREVGQSTLVATMHTTGLALAVRTERTRGSCMDGNGHAIWEELGGVEPQQRTRWQEERFEHR